MPQTKDDDQRTPSMQQLDDDKKTLKNLKVSYSSDNYDVWNPIKDNQALKTLEIDSRESSPNFITQDDFYIVLQSAPNLFFIDVAIAERNMTDNDETIIKSLLKDIEKPLIIQCESLSNTKIYVKEVSKEPIVLDLNTNIELFDEEVLIEKLSNKENFGLPLVVDALKSNLVGEFNDDLAYHRSLNRVTFYVNKTFDSWKLIDYAAWHDDFLSARFLSLYDWALGNSNESEQRTLEIAAEYASLNTLAALLDLQLPISNETITLPDSKVAFLKLSNNNGNTPLLIAAEIGKKNNVDFLIRCGVDVNYYNEKTNKSAIDLAWENKHYDTVLTLLKADSSFPNIKDKPFTLEEITDDNNVPEELKVFLKKRKILLTWIKEQDLKQDEKLQQEEIIKLIMNHKLIEYLKNSQGKSEILIEAINSEQYKIYAFLQSVKITFKDEQEQHACFKLLNDLQKDELQKAIKHYFSPVKDAHIMFLVLKSKNATPLTNHEAEEFKEKVEDWYRKLDKIDEISVILKAIAVRYSGLEEIIFDEVRKSIIGTCTHGSHTTPAITDYEAGHIRLGAKMEESELLGTLAHELTHFAMQRLYRNEYNPYDKSENGEKFEQITKTVHATIDLDPIINHVFENYKQKEWHSELIVRIPHVLAKYGKEKGTALLSTQASELLNYYRERIVSSCNMFVQEKHLIQPRNDIELLNQYLEVIDTIKKSGIELNNPIEIKNFLFQKQQENFKNFLLVRTTNTLLSSCSIYQSLQKVPEYLKPNSSLFLRLDQFKQKIFDIFKSDAIDLLVMIYSNNRKQVQNVLMDLNKILPRKLDKKIIFIIQASEVIKLKDDLKERGLANSYLELEDKAFTLNDLTAESQEKMLKKEITFQGQKISLNKLIDDNSKKLIDSETLVKLINNDEVTIGHALINLGEIRDYYIDRFFRYIEIKQEIRQDAAEQKFSDILVINDNKEEFTRLCEQHPQSSVHWLRSKSRKLIWQESRGSISNLIKYREENKDYNYVSKETGLGEEALVNYDNQRKIIIISDTAGMGKSTVLTNLAQKIKELNPALWLVRIDLNDYTNQLKELKEKGNFKARDIDSAITFLTNDLLKLSTSFELALFKHCCQHIGKLIVMFDGFDEISPDYRETVIELIQVLRNSEIKQLWVTTRPTEKVGLEDQLQQFAYTLEPFSEKHQIEFLSKFWRQKLEISGTNQEQQERLEIYAKALIKLLAKSISDKDTEFTGIPLQTRMLAEAFEKDFAEFCKSKETKLQLPEKLDLIDLYERFLNHKYVIYQVEKNKLDLSKPRVKIQSDKSYSKFIEQHQNMALYTLFNKETSEILLNEKCLQELKDPELVASYTDEQKALVSKRSQKEIESFIQGIEHGKENKGIIDQIIEGKPHFIHRTFAEYLVAKFLVNSLKQPMSEEIAKFLLKEILLEPNYQVIRAFFNSQLARKTLPESTLARYGYKINELWKLDPKNLCDKYDDTILHIAVKENNNRIVSFVLDSLEGYDNTFQALVNTKDSTGRIVLHLAAFFDNLEVVKLLVEKGVDVDVKNGDGNTALHMATNYGNLELVQWLVKPKHQDGGGANVNAKDQNQDTVLHKAVDKGSLDIVRLLIQHGSNVNAKNNDEYTVLHNAIHSIIALEIVSLLVEKGAIVNVKDEDGNSVLHYAAYNGKLDVVKFLVAQKANVCDIANDKSTVLHEAALSGNKELCEWLINEHKLDVNAQDENNRIPLHEAAEKDNLDIVKLLIQQGSKVNAKDKYGNTVLLEAAKYGSPKLCEWLINEHNLNIKDTNDDDRTMLHVATKYGNLELVEWLLEQGFDPNVKDKYGNIVLTEVSKYEPLCSPKVVKYNNVLWKKASLEKNAYIRTNTHSTQDIDIAIIQCLVKYGAKIDTQDTDGKTILHYAAERNQSDIVKWLITAQDKGGGGANVNAKDSNGKTPLNLAEEQENEEITKYLKQKMVESVGQDSTELAIMPDVPTVNEPENDVDLGGAGNNIDFQ